MATKTAVEYSPLWEKEGWDEPTELYSVRKSPDIIMKVRRVKIDHLSYIDIRDWIESQNAWGRGYWFEDRPQVLMAMASALLEAASLSEEAS
jgi:hypothetical protein